jgi:tetrahydromethanopterin S-methyltransferase subunit D
MSLDTAAALLVVLAVVNIVCTAVLVGAAHRFPNPALLDRAFVGVLLAFVAIGSGLLGLRALGFVELNRDQVLLILTGAMALVSLPSVVWVVQLWRGRFAR